LTSFIACPPPEIANPGIVQIFGAIAQEGKTTLRQILSDAEHGPGAGAEASLDKHPSWPQEFSRTPAELGAAPARRAHTAPELRGSVSWLL